jgi:hypothetical protein
VYKYFRHLFERVNLLTGGTRRESYEHIHRYALCRVFLQHTVEQVPDRPFDLSRHLEDSRFDFQQKHADVVVIEGQTTSDQSEKDDAA